ncbi:MAG: hypothetical protein U1F48_05905 [Burkholderiales bacterium]
MALLGNAAMLLWYDIVPEEIAQHDEWHTREHFPERTGIPGFLRATRWVAQGATAPRYLVSYEVRDVAVLTSAPYQARLNDPTPWTRRIMPHFRGMVRGFCGVERRIGTALGAEMLALRYAPAAGRADALAQWIADAALASIAATPGFASAFVLAAAVAPPMTEEQKLRGRDATVDRVVLVTGYDAAPIEEAARLLAPEALAAQGAEEGSLVGRYRLVCTEVAPELRAGA